MLRIAQDGEGQRETEPQGFRFFGRIDGDGRYTCAGRADCWVVVSVIRQLAKAERSPIPAIEEQHQRAVGD